MSMLSELWAEIAGVPHPTHVVVPWGYMMLAGFIGAAVTALIVRRYRGGGQGSGRRR